MRHPEYVFSNTMHLYTFEALCKAINVKYQALLPDMLAPAAVGAAPPGAPLGTG